MISIIRINEFFCVIESMVWRNIFWKVNGTNLILIVLYVMQIKCHPIQNHKYQIEKLCVRTTYIWNNSPLINYSNNFLSLSINNNHIKDQQGRSPSWISARIILDMEHCYLQNVSRHLTCLSWEYHIKLAIFYEMFVLKP